MKAIRDKIILIPWNEGKMKYESKGILLPADAENVLPYRGRVLSVGKKVKDIKVGMLIYFDRLRAGSSLNGNGEKFKYKGQELLCIPERLVKGIYDESDTEASDTDSPTDSIQN